ncbi:MAG: reverse transcriptase domain-containing protein [Coxiellaceae bacterium]|nr:reverse transcriptase domain-containing protein [Coxiellaceae bacterium]
MSNKLHRLAALLQQPETYFHQIHRLQQKLLMRNRLYETQQDDVSFYQFCMHDKKVAKILANSIKQQSYQYQPAVPRTIKTKTKERIVYSFRPTDRIVQSALSASITPYVQQIISPSVYSYIPGRSNYQAARQAAAYFKQHKSLYALRSDIVAYTDNIPTTTDSVLWAQYKQLIQLIDPNNTLSDYLWQLILLGVRPIIKSGDDNCYQLCKGLPQGAPLTTIAANLYLQPVDNLLSSIPGGFYARFGDDLLFAHPDHHTLLETEDLLNKQLAQLKLHRNSDKDQYSYLTDNGRKDQTDTQFSASHFMNFLGFRINKIGTIGIAKHISHRLLGELKQRVRNTIRLVGRQHDEQHGKTLCKMLNHNFQHTSFLDEPRMKQLLDCCTDRQQLKDMDYHLALYLSQQLTGCQGVRAFRQISYKTIRDDWGLQSLCQLRNHVSWSAHANT